MAAENIRLKIQNNSDDQTLVLHDIGLALFAAINKHYSNHYTNLRGQNIRLKIQNNSNNQTLYLFECGLDVHKYERR